MKIKLNDGAIIKNCELIFEKGDSIDYTGKNISLIGNILGGAVNINMPAIDGDIDFYVDNNKVRGNNGE